MKKLLLSFCLFSVPFISNSQTPYYTTDSINGNNINARAMIHGSMWSHPLEGRAACEFPTGSGKHVGFYSGILLSGYENGNILHLSYAHDIDTFNTNGYKIDFWPGPLDNSGNTDNATIDKWAKIWKVTSADIDNFLAQTNHTVNNTPAAVLHWPGRGNTYARGNNNILLDIQEDMAPYYDFNSNGKYEPLLGEYPLLKGKQLLWWVINDNGPLHNATNNGQSLKIQVEVTADAYSNGTLKDNVVYYSYRLKNRSGINYTNMRFGQYVDFDLGVFSNDYVGYDSTFRIGYVYNDSSDGNWGYGNSVPIVGLTFIVVPGDNGNNHLPLGGFRSLNYNFNEDSEYFLDSSMRIMQPYFNECTDSAIPGDRKFIISTDDFNLAAGTWDGIVTALVVADPSPNNVCPFFDSTTIKIVADTAWGNHWQTLTIGNQEQNLENINLYPNPAHNTIILSGANVTAKTNIVLYDALGRKHDVAIQKKGNEAIIDIKNLPCGMYVLSIDGHYSKRFVKQ